VPNAIIVVDQAGTIKLVNPQTEELFGYSRQELIGKPVEILLPGILRQPHPAHRAGYFSNPTTRPWDVTGISLTPVRRHVDPFRPLARSSTRRSDR